MESRHDRRPDHHDSRPVRPCLVPVRVGDLGVPRLARGPSLAPLVDDREVQVTVIEFISQVIVGAAAFAAGMWWERRQR